TTSPDYLLAPLRRRVYPRSSVVLEMLTTVKAMFALLFFATMAMPSFAAAPSPSVGPVCNPKDSAGKRDSRIDNCWLS
ncbi:hypothetical protein OH77DRAFT_1425966, partial [Trametes cingulata]